MKHGNPFKRAYQAAKDNAKTRGIEFFMTFKEWMSIWEQSGHLKKRGRERGQYVMARFGDTGAYAVGNVKIITGRKNIQEWRPTAAQKANHRNGMLGNKNKLGKKESAETRAKKRFAHLGSPPTKGCTGMRWITNGSTSRLLPNNAPIPKAFWFGRTPGGRT